MGICLVNLKRGGPVARVGGYQQTQGLTEIRKKLKAINLIINFNVMIIFWGVRKIYEIHCFLKQIWHSLIQIIHRTYFIMRAGKIPMHFDIYLGEQR